MTPAPRRGLALLVVAGVLGLLSALSTVFVVLSRLERRAAQARLEGTHAVLLARSGVEDAAARLSAGQDPSYGGENWDGDPIGLLSTFEATQEVFHPTGAGTAADRGACPVRHALRPSFFARAAGNPLLVGVDGRRRGLSGAVGSRDYALKVEAAGRLCVNDGDPAAPPGAGYNAVLRRVLGTLAEALDREDGTDDGAPVDDPDGRALVDLRPSSGWASEAQIRSALGAAKADALLPYLCLSSWRDLKAVAPNAQAAMSGATPMGWVETRRAPGFEAINGKVVGRSPVDFQWARSRRPVLIALLAGLGGLWLDEVPANCITDGGRIGELKTARLTLDWALPTDPCRTAAAAFLASTQPLEDRQAFDAFCDTLLLPGIPEEVEALRDLIKANFDPNALLNKSNPDRIAWRRVDKSDLLPDGYSTEFLLRPLSWEIRAQGRVPGPGERLLASAEAGGRFSRDAATLTTQAEFCAGSLGSLTRAGDEGAQRLPGASAFLSQAQGADPAWGHRLNTGAGWMDGSSGGAGLQGYPEPYGAPAADYDGCLRLATLETPDGETYGASGAPAQMMMLARFTTGLDLELGADPGCEPDAELVLTGEESNGLFDATKPNTRHPDGCYSEWRRAPAYRDRSNLHALHGVISFWIKRGYDREQTPNRGHPLVWRTRWEMVDTGAALVPAVQFFLVADVKTSMGSNEDLACQFEVGHLGPDDWLEHRFSSQGHPPSRGVWNLVTFAWDFLADQKDRTGRFVRDSGAGTGDDGAADLYSSSGADPALAAWITSDDEGGVPHLTVLGYRDTVLDGVTEIMPEMGYGADATFDEFAAYDFGGAGGVGMPAPAATYSAPRDLASERYASGRYYKGSEYVVPSGGPVADQAGSWVSAPMDLPEGLREVRWTWRRPASLPGDYPEVEVLEASGAAWFSSPSESRSTCAAGWSPDRGAWILPRSVAGPFRLRVSFRRTSAVGPSTPVLESPVLDDLWAVHGGRFTGWDPSV